MKVPICPKCGKPMLSSMCIAFNEFVCIPCGHAEEFFNDCERITISDDEHDTLYEKYKKDIHKLAFEKGGAECSGCNKKGGNHCDLCNIDYDYEYWGKGG